MKKTFFLFIFVGLLLSGCAAAAISGQKTAPHPLRITSVNAATASVNLKDKGLPKTCFATYYLSSKDPVHSYLQNKSIQRFFQMWIKDLDKDLKANWNYDSIAPIQYLDHNFNSLARPGEQFYTCTFSANGGRYGYIIVLYGEGKEGPYIKKLSLHETTPYQYGLRANETQIAAALKKTDIDLPTASAQRVEWIDTDKNRGDRIVLFTDGKQDQYICYLGNASFEVKKRK